MRADWLFKLPFLSPKHQQPTEKSNDERWLGRVGHHLYEGFNYHHRHERRMLFPRPDVGGMSAASAMELNAEQVLNPHFDY